MQDSIYHKDNLKVLGRLFKKYREETGYSIRGVSRSINISHTVISDIENCKIYPNRETLKELYDAIDVPLCTDETILKECQQILEALNEAIYFWEPHDIVALSEKLKKHDIRILHSPLRIDYILAQQLVDVMYHHKLETFNPALLEDDFDFMSSKQQATVHFIKGIHSFYSQQYETSLPYFTKNIKNLHEDKLFALSVFYLSFAYNKLYRNYETLYYADIASNILTKQSNKKLKIEIDLLKAQKWIDEGYIEPAKNIVHSLQNAIEFQQEVTDISNRFEPFKIYLLYSEKKYDEALEYISALNRKEPSHLLFKAIIAHKVNNEPLIKKSLEDLLMLPNKDDQYFVIGQVFAYLKEGDVNKETVYKTIESVLKRPYRFASVHLLHMMFDLIFEVYFKNNETERLIKALKIYKSIQKSRDNHETNLYK